MHRSLLDYDLPEELIAQYPARGRSGSRLLALDADSGELEDLRFRELISLLSPGDLLVFNDTRVMKARLLGRKTTGGKVELLVERVLDDERVCARIRSSRPLRCGQCIALEEGVKGELLRRGKGGRGVVRLVGPLSAMETLERIGVVPLPPYIRRRAHPADAERYQTVYARRLGAVAAPTAGLHFDRALMRRLRQAGIEQAFVTLHTGAGTFEPVRAARIQDHHMHAEYAEVAEEACAQVLAAQARGSRVIAVGTTTVRALESAAQGDGTVKPFKGNTTLFIYPSYEFRCTDALISNFHLPGSTLLLLVYAFAGRDKILGAYRYAIERRFRFFSYGDAMFLTRGSR
jgi:S-adenosylmethionine:tRNA ribosyltransferase-isomerase